MTECLQRQPAIEVKVKAKVKRLSLGLNLNLILSLSPAQHRGIIRRIADHCHRLEILSRRAQQRHAADIDLLDGFRLSHARLRHGRGEGIEVADNQIDRCDVVAGQLCKMLRRAAGQDAAVNRRVQCLHAAAKDLRGTGDLVYLRDGQPCRAECARGAARRDQLEA